MIDPYEVLGVSPAAPQAEITHAYREQLRACHPDLRPTVNSGADERLRLILDAYALLRDPRRRADYDGTRLPRDDRVARDDDGESRVRVSPIGRTNPEPPLWAGPVRRHRR